METPSGVTLTLAAFAWLVWLVCLGALAQTPEPDPRSSSGDWQTFWRDGLATMTLRQSGDTVTGSFSPGEGRVDAVAEGDVLRGTWRSPGNAGEFIFAMSDGGETFTGRFGNGEDWNGSRSWAVLANPGLPIRRGSPHDLLESLLLRFDAAVASLLPVGRVAALGKPGDGAYTRGLNKEHERCRAAPI